MQRYAPATCAIFTAGSASSRRCYGVQGEIGQPYPHSGHIRVRVAITSICSGVTSYPQFGQVAFRSWMIKGAPMAGIWSVMDDPAPTDLLEEVCVIDPKLCPTSKDMGRGRSRPDKTTFFLSVRIEAGARVQHFLPDSPHWTGST
jgi:hypothetical protein